MTTAETLTAAADKVDRSHVRVEGEDDTVEITDELVALLRAEAEIAAEDVRLFGRYVGSDAGDAALALARAILGEVGIRG